MNNNEKQSFLKGKGASVALVIGFVAVIALVGTFTFRNYQNKLEKQMAQAEKETEDMTKVKTEETTTDDIILPEPIPDPETSVAKEDVKAAEDESAADSTEETAGNTYNVWFDENSTLDWPASGAVLIDYSMDKTVFFPTLEQYKYNPALIVGGEIGEMIGAAQEGIVSSIEQDAQTGLSVTVDMGNGYSAVYGQLKEVPVEIGMYVNKGQTLGHLSEPTKYYSVEGPNLYFELLKDGVPINPLDYMEG